MRYSVLIMITQVSGKTSNLACTVKNLGNQTVIRCWSTCHDYHDDHDDHHDHHHYHDEEVHGGDRHEYNDVEALSLEYRQCVNFWLKSFEPLIFQQTKFIRTRLWAPINIFEELFAYFVLQNQSSRKHRKYICKVSAKSRRQKSAEKCENSGGEI